MKHREDDIDLSALSGFTFEEMCFDLLRQLGFDALVWRQGGADQGRDIEGRLTLTNPMLGATTENWIFECKHLSTGVGVADLADKIAWADAEKPDHFSVFTSSHLTNACRSWFEKSREHTVSGTGSMPSKGRN